MRRGVTGEGRRPSVASRRRLPLLVAILLVAAAFRFVALDNFPTPIGASPPGLEHDEVAHWLINRDILAGNHAIYFTEAYGHEALYHYLQAAFGAAVGDHALALRLPSAYFGVLLVSVAYALGRRLFGPDVGLWSAVFLAVLFWPVFYSRLALRAISLPVFSGLAACAWWRAMPPEDGRRASSAKWLLAGGVLAGLSIHTYMAARAVPIFFALYTVYLALFHRPLFRRLWRGIALFWLALLLVAAPLALYLRSNPDAEVRIGEVDAPLRALLAGDVGPVVENGVRIAGMFGVSGDPLWRQNVAGRPTFDPLMGALFYAGVAYSVWRWRDRRHAFLLLWLAASVIPSLVTVDAPSSIRIVNLLPVLMLLPMTVIHKVPHLSTIREKLSTDLTTRGVNLLLAGLLFLNAAGTLHAVWRVWPNNDEVRFVWQAALTEAAVYLDQSAASGPVAVGGWTPETMDAPTMELTLRRDDLSLRYFDPTQSLILPASPDNQPIRIVKPSILPLAVPLHNLISSWEETFGEFTLHELPATLPLNPATSAKVEFGGRLLYLGHDIAEGCAPGGRCQLVTYWRVIAPTDEPLRFFLHAVDGAGEIVAQDDRLGAPAEHWRVGDVVVQLLTVEETAAELRLGVYNPGERRRLTTTEGAEYFVITP